MPWRTQDGSNTVKSLFNWHFLEKISHTSNTVTTHMRPKYILRPPRTLLCIDNYIVKIRRLEIDQIINYHHTIMNYYRTNETIKHNHRLNLRTLYRPKFWIMREKENKMHSRIIQNSKKKMIRHNRVWLRKRRIERSEISRKGSKAKISNLL